MVAVVRSVPRPLLDENTGDGPARSELHVPDAVDHVVGTGLADAERVGVTGGSHGGYATAWLANRHSERFGAGHDRPPPGPDPEPRAPWSARGKWQGRASAFSRRCSHRDGGAT